MFRATHRVASTLDGKPEASWVDTYSLRCRATGDCHGRLDNSLEYGVEFIRLGAHTYFRHRYQEFLRFREEPREAQRRAQRIWGAGAAVTTLLERWLRLVPAGSKTVGGRTGSLYRLEKRSRPRAVTATGRRAWRARLHADAIAGEVVLDSATGVVLRLQVRYAVWATRGTHKIGVTGTYEGSLTGVGTTPAVAPPARFTRATPRAREALDERRLLRDQRLRPGWFRGGGPYEARRHPARRGAPRPGMSPVRRRRAAPRPAPSRAMAGPP